MPSHPCLDAQKRDEIMNSVRHSGPSLPSQPASPSLALAAGRRCLEAAARRAPCESAPNGRAAAVSPPASPAAQLHWPRQLRAKPTDHRGPASRWLISKSNYRCRLKSPQPRAAWGRTLLSYCLGEMVAK